MIARSLAKHPSRAGAALTPESRTLRRKCACGRHLIAGGECQACKRRREASPGRPARGLPPAGATAKLRVGPADDDFEREADRVAQAVAAGRPAAVAPARVDALQRAEDDAGPVNDAEARLEEEADPAPDEAEASEALDEPDDDSGGDASGRPKLQAGAQPARAAAAFTVPRGAGHPLDPPVRRFMEERIGHPLGHVRAHDDVEADSSARRLNARAYTLGSDIYFAGGEYRPADPEGRKLLAHELAHVVQQSGGGSQVLRRAPKKEQQGTEGAKEKGKPKPKAQEGPKCGPATCDNKCAPPSAAAAHHPWCGNETCTGSAAANSSNFIHYADVNLATQDLTLHWGDGKTTASRETMLSSPNPDLTPTGLTKAGVKCGPCHTNKKPKVSGMGWFTSFRNTYEYGFHNSQKVAKGVQSHGCVRVVDCATAERIQKNMASGVTDVCVHKGKGCDVKPPPMRAQGGGSSPSPEPAPPAVSDTETETGADPANGVSV
jgi:hypothetical protein